MDRVCHPRDMEHFTVRTGMTAISGWTGLLNSKNGQTSQSIPVAPFDTQNLGYLPYSTAYPAIYPKDRVVGPIRAARDAESKDDARARGDREFMELQQSPFFRVWSSAGADEILSTLHERLLVGSLG